jgi:hypothetical protein
MRSVAFLQRVCLWLFATAVFFVGTSVVVGPSWSAPQADHLQCYQVKDQKPQPGPKKTVTTLNTQFGQAECKVNKTARYICAPTIKNGGDDIRGDKVAAPDYTCYTATCKLKHKKSIHVVDDQFRNRVVRVLASQLICAPAIKGPPLECGFLTAPQCDGACPTGQKCVSGTIENEDTCFCQ